MSVGHEAQSTHNLIIGLESLSVDEKVVEIRFKNNRKSIYRNIRGLKLQENDRVVVEAEGGHDLGTISMIGNLTQDKTTLKQILRKATREDLELWIDAKRREREVLVKSRGLAAEHDLKIRIYDTEFRADGKLVNLFYTADKNKDLGNLLRKITSSLGIAVEMKQILSRPSGMTH
jgi:cell fate regulator YaaT (PSP1 superfamily)